MIPTEQLIVHTIAKRLEFGLGPVTARSAGWTYRGGQLDVVNDEGVQVPWIRLSFLRCIE